LQKKNYRNSLRVGWPLISAMRSAQMSTATTECSACKMQIEHGSGRPTLHPLKLLAYAYGRMPKVERELNRS
jgi:Fe-S oxidoreductase